MLNAQNLLIESPALDLMLTCQPVFTSDKAVTAFDLILRQLSPETPLAIEHIQAAVPVVLESYCRIVQQGKFLTVPSIVKIPQYMLGDTQLLALPREQLILELVINEQLTPDTLSHIRALAESGHQLALHDYDPRRTDLDALLDCVRIARLNLQQLPEDLMQPALNKLRSFGVKALAAGISSPAQFQQCVERIGASYFQGTFFGEATPVEGKKISGNKALLLELLSKLQDPDATAASLEALAIRDTNLTFRILRIVNSAAQSVRREVDTLSQAITLLGTEEIKRWVNLFLVEAEPGKPEELTRNMLLRARMCEILAELDNQAMPVNYFLVGLLSQLDVLMDISMADLVEQLPLRQEVTRALLHREGSPGEILADIEHYEVGQFDQLSARIDPAYYEVAYRHASSWARQMQFELYS